jgi:predicted dehydrogenase
MTRIKLALLGCGDVAQRDYLPEMYRLAENAELVAVCGRSPGRVQRVANQYGIREQFSNYVDMLAQTDAEAILNLTPIQIHAELTLAALQAGKHVYTEKPLASSVAEARRLKSLAAERGLTLVCAPSVMLFPQVNYASSFLSSGDAGPLVSARGLCQGGVPPWPGYSSDPAPFFAKGAGPAIDLGVYPLHAITGLLGPARRVTAVSTRAQHQFVVPDGPAAGKTVPIGVDDTWLILLVLEGGQVASLEANFSAQGTRAPQLEIFGLSATLALNLLDVSVPVELLRAGQDWESVAVPRAGRAAGPDHFLGVAHLVDCVQGRAANKLTAAHAAHVIEILEQAAQSAATGQTLRVESTF